MAFFSWTGNFSLAGSGGTDNDAFHKSIPAEISALVAKTPLVDADSILVEDSAAADAKKKFSQTALRLAATQIGDGRANNDANNNYSKMLSTGYIEGGLLTINAGDNTTFDMTAGKGIIIDRTVDFDNPVVTEVSWPARTAQAVPDITLFISHAVWIDVTGAIVVTTASDRINPVTYRGLIQCGFVVSLNLVNLDSVVDNAYVATAPMENISDFALAVGPLNITGNVYGPNAAGNLQMDKTVGVSYFIGGFPKVQPLSPNVATFAALSPHPGWGYQFRKLSGEFNSVPANLINSANYDDGTGILATLAPNKFTVQRIFTTGAITLVYHGQNVYNSQAEAEAAIPTEDFFLPPEASQILFRGWIVIKEGTTDLTVAGDAKFISAGKFSSVSSSGVSGGEMNTSSNVGIGAGQLAKTKAGVDLPFKTILDGANITVSNLTDEVQIAVTGSLPDARVQESNVTQHVGALNINSLLNYPLTTLGDLFFGGASGAATRLARGALGQFLNATATTIEWANQKLALVGTALLPSYSFNGDPNTGVYSPGADSIGFATNGVERVRINSVGAILGANGAVASPSHSFLSDSNTGAWRSAADTYDISTNGIQGFRMTSAQKVSLGTPATQTQGQAARLHLTATSATVCQRTMGNNTGGDGATDLYNPSTGVFTVAVNGSSPTTAQAYTIAANGTVQFGHPELTGQLNVRSRSNGRFAGKFASNETSGTGIGLVQFLDGAGTQCGAIVINADANTAAYGTTSDRRLKFKFKPYSGLEIINRLNTVSCERKSAPGPVEYTLFAQDIKNEFPQAMARKGDDTAGGEGRKPYMMDYSQFAAPLIRSVQELDDKSDTSESRLNDALARIDALETALAGRLN